MQRPKLKLHGGWAFGFTLQLVIVEENQYAGSAMVQEILMVTIEKAMAQCRERGNPCPDTIVTIGDNTVKELKNTVNLSYAASLINHSKVRFASFVIH